MIWKFETCKIRYFQSLVGFEVVKAALACYSRTLYYGPNDFAIQCSLDIATLDMAAALAIATSTPVTEASRYIQSALHCTKQLTF